MTKIDRRHLGAFCVAFAIAGPSAFAATALPHVWYLGVQQGLRENVGFAAQKGTAAPDGGPALKLIETSADGYHRVEVSAKVAPGASYRFSISARAAGRDALVVELRDLNMDAGGVYGRAAFDLKAHKASIAQAMQKAQIKPVRGGWDELSAVIRFKSSEAIIDVGLAEQGGGSRYPGKTSAGVLIGRPSLQKISD